MTRPEQDGARLPGLDGLRGLACLSVMAAHSVGFTSPHGFSFQVASIAAQSVVAFFALSGFLIFLPFARGAAGLSPRPRLTRYASARLRRVYPTYLAIFGLASLLGAVYVTNAVTTAVPRTDTGTGRITEPGPLLEHASLVQNLLPSGLQTGLNVSWSLTTELCFYLLVPLLAALLTLVAGRGGWRLPWVLAPGLLMAGVGLTAKALLLVHQEATGLSDGEAQFGPTWHAVLTRGLLGQADTFAPGLIVVVLFVSMQRGELASWTGRTLWRWCSLVILVGLIGNLLCVHYAVRLDGTFFALAVGGYLLLVVEPSARGQRAVLGRWCDVQPLRFYADVSLSAYLLHYPVLILLIRHDLIGGESALGAVWTCLLVVAITTPAAWLSHRFIEVPTMHRSRRPGKQAAN